MIDDPEFEACLQRAMQLPFSGWDFSPIRNRWHEESPSWDYRRLVLERMPRAGAVLDMGTGGGEFLAGLAADQPFPPLVCATEAYPPNLPLAAARLKPLGVRVESPVSDDALPFEDGLFDLVINRHESYHPGEVWRILKPGGIFLTQQVGATDCIRLNHLLQANAHLAYAHWNMPYAARELLAAGFQVLQSLEEFPRTTFADIGAVIYYLRAIPWQIPDFDLQIFRERLYNMYRIMKTEGGLHLTSHRFLLETRKTA